MKMKMAMVLVSPWMHGSRHCRRHRSDGGLEGPGPGPGPGPGLTVMAESRVRMLPVLQV